MRKIILIMLVIITNTILGQVGINTTHPNGALDVNATPNNYGFVSPRVPKTDVVSNPAGGSIVDGTVVFDELYKCLKVYSNNSWSGCINTPQGKIDHLDCSKAVVNGNLTPSTSAIISIPYKGGNGGNYGAIISPSTGVTGYTATNPGGTLSNGDGVLTLHVTGSSSSGQSGNANFSITLGEQTCTVSISITNGTISNLNCHESTASGEFIENEASIGTLTIPYNGGNGGAYSGFSVQSTGVTGLIASIGEGNFANGSGNLVFEISGVPNSMGTASFLIDIGGQTCTANIIVVSSLITVIQIGQGVGYFPTGTPIIGGGIGTGTGSLIQYTKTKLTTVLTDFGKEIEYLGLIPTANAAEELQKILTNTAADGKKRNVALIFTGYTRGALNNCNLINQVIQDYYMRKGKIFLVSRDEAGWDTMLKYWGGNSGYSGTYISNPTYTIDGNKLIDPEDTWPTIFGGTPSSGPISGKAGAFLNSPINASVAAVTQNNRPIIFKDNNYFNGKLWVFGDTNAYWEYGGGYVATPLHTNSCTGNNRDRWTCNMFRYVTLKNLGITP